MAVDTITKADNKVSTFPKAAVEAQLKNVLLEAALSNAAIEGITLPADVAAQAAAHVRLDSLDVVSLLCHVEPIVDFELKDSLVRAGGYSSVNQAMDHLMPRIEKAWVKHGNKDTKK